MARRKKKKISELRQEAVAWVFVLPYFLIFFTFTVLSVLISISSEYVLLRLQIMFFAGQTPSSHHPFYYIFV